MTGMLGPPLGAKALSSDPGGRRKSLAATRFFNCQKFGHISAHCPERKHSSAEDVPFSSPVGSLLYLAGCTRSDLAHSVNMHARFVSNPTVQQV